MDDAMKKEKERNIDQLAVKWYTAKVNGDEAAVQKHRNDIWREMTEIYFPIEKLEKAMGELFDERWTTYMDTLEEVLKKYQPDVEDSSFTHYFSRIYMFRKKDARSDKQKEQRKLDSMDQAKTENMDKPKGNSPKQFEDTRIGDPSESMIIAEFLADLMGLILNFSDNHKGKGNNERKKLWYHLFYTEDITVFTKRLHKEETRVPKYIHERDIFNVMRLPYLNFYMSSECKNLADIAYYPLKNYEEIIPDVLEEKIGKEIQSERKIPAEVSIQYLAVCENITASDSARSNQKKTYDEEKRALL